MNHRSTSSSTRRRALLAGMAGVALMPGAQAQRGGPGVRVGWLGWTGAVGTSASALALAAFRVGLADRGWTEGKDLEVLVRDGDRPRSAELASELLALDIKVLVAQGPMAFGAKTVTGAKPLVFSINGDPVEAGLVASLSHPGGNLTGVTALSAELAGKRLELLKEALRKGVRVAVLANAVHPGVALEREATHAAARRLGLTVAWYPLQAPTDLNAALVAIARDGADALLAIPDNLINREARPIADFATAHRLPSISGWSEFAEAGNLMSYGPNPGGYYRQMALITDRILRGARPADLAVEQPRELEFVVNAKAARAIGLALPPGLLLRANRQIA
jgi:putative ABC transport system substrate-binding protein